MYGFTGAEGPLLPTQRAEFPHLDAYVEARNVRRSTGIGWEIEHGSLRFGHRGTWGRWGVREAMKCFADAIAYETRED
jgi:hypothetical protein